MTLDIARGTINVVIDHVYLVVAIIIRRCCNCHLLTIASTKYTASEEIDADANTTCNKEAN